MKDPPNYSLGDQKIPDASCYKYLGIIIRNDLSLADQINYTVQKAWRPLHFVMLIVKKGGKNTKFSLYVISASHSRYVAACWDRYTECQISALGRVENNLLNLRIIREAQSGNIWRSVGRQHACVHPTKRIPVRGRGKR